MRSCAAGEAAPMAFSYRLLEVFSEIPEKPKGRIGSIPFLYPLDGSVGYRFRGARPIVQGKAQIAM